jgi:large subunit ribosomal protein L29
MMKIKELKEMTNEELATQRRDLKHERINLRVQQQSGQLENPARIRTVRRTIARIETILSSRRLEDVAVAS